MLTPANTCGCSHSRRETPQRQSKGARGARCKPPRSARRRSAGSFGNGEGASEATPTGYHPRCPCRLRVCEEAGRKLFPRLRSALRAQKDHTNCGFCLCSSNLRRKTMPAPQRLAVPQQRGSLLDARGGGPVHWGGGTFPSAPTLPCQQRETGKRNLCCGLGRLFHFLVSHVS